MADEWPDERTRKLLVERAVQDEGGEPRAAALKGLMKKWPDETTRELLVERAVQDEDVKPRSYAMRALNAKWPDETTRELLTERAVRDTDEEVRVVALRALAARWPDKTTRKLLALRAVQDHAAASILGGIHSKFGLIVFTPDLSGFRSFLDPTKSISRDHIIRAAKEANIPASRIEETVGSLSEHLGWDITAGLGE